MLELTLILPPDNRQIEVSCSDDMTASDIITELISANCLNKKRGYGYGLAQKGSILLDSSKTLNESNVKNGSIIRVVPLTDAG